MLKTGFKWVHSCGYAEDANNDTNSITRTEFVELLVRIAAAKHMSLGRTQDLGEAMEIFCAETIVANLPHFVAEVGRGTS